jgi:hypothetical protein
VRRLLWFWLEHRRIRRELAALPPPQTLSLPELIWRLEQIERLEQRAATLRRHRWPDCPESRNIAAG